MPVVRIPSAADPIGTFDAVAAWQSFSQVKRDLIGALAIRAAFGWLISEEDFAPEDQVLGAAVQAQGYREHDTCTAAMEATIKSALPDIFGDYKGGPDWIDAAASPEQRTRWAANESEGEALQALAAPTEDRRSDAEIANAAIRGLRGILAPASLLAEA